MIELKKAFMLAFCCALYTVPAGAVAPAEPRIVPLFPPVIAPPVPEDFAPLPAPVIISAPEPAPLGSMPEEVARTLMPARAPAPVPEASPQVEASAPVKISVPEKIVPEAPEIKTAEAKPVEPMQGESVVHVTPRYDEPVFDKTHSLKEIQSLAGDAITLNLHPSRGTVALGLTRYEPTLSFNIKMSGLKTKAGMCMHVRRLDAVVGYKHVTVYVPREVPQPGCAYDEILTHERKHIAANRAILDTYLPRIEAALEAELDDEGFVCKDTREEALAAIHADLKGVLDKFNDEMNDDNEEKQHEVDSPEEYTRVRSVCGGELHRIATKYRMGWLDDSSADTPSEN